MASLSGVGLVGSLLLVGTGCVGEAGVAYRGSVVAAPSPGYSFDDKENPAGLAAIAGAEVRLCVCDGPCACKDEGAKATTDAAGHYSIPTVVFPGMIGVDNVIVVRASADGFEPVTYRLDYDKRSAPDEEHEPRTGAKPLNFRLRPIVGAPAKARAHSTS